MNTLPPEWQAALPLLQQLDTAIWLYHFPQQTIIWANRAALLLWDAPDLEALQQRDFSMGSEAARQRLAAYRAAFARQQSLRESWTIYPRGRPVHIDCHCAQLAPQLPDIMRVEASARDVEADTTRALEMLRHVREMVSLYDLHGRVLLRNPAASRYLPCADDAFAASLRSPAQVAELRLAVSESRSVRRIVDVQLEDGSVARHQMQLVEVPDPVSGDPALLVSQHDVSDREKLLQLQRERSEELQSILDALPLPMLITELDSGRIRYANHLALELYGTWQDHHELTPLSLGLYDNQDDRRQFVELLQLQGMVSDFQTVLCDRRQQRFDASLTGCLVDYRGVPSILASVLNISHIRERERSLEASLLHERELLDMQRRFVSMVSHEYRTPLAVIDGIAQRILRHPQQFDQALLQQRLQRMRDMVKHMVSLTDSVLTLGRLETSPIVLEHTPVPLQPLLQELIELNRDVYPACHISLSAPSEALLQVEGDAELLRLVFSNLINNAIKYSPPAQQRVALQLSQQGQTVSVAVQDWGVGVPQAEQDKLFTRFFRASTAQGIPGCGIGLALVKALLALHHGSVTLQSAPGQGSVFTVSLPLTQPDPSAA